MIDHAHILLVTPIFSSILWMIEHAHHAVIEWALVKVSMLGQAVAHCSDSERGFQWKP